MFALTAACALPSAGESAWKPAPSPMMTRWAKDVSPENVHPEYPRPQMARKEWLNLNGLWQFAQAAPGQDPPTGRDLTRRILVPFPVESALSGVGERGDRFWYRRMFSVPETWKGQRVLLHFEASDWETTVWVNGKKLGTHRGGYDPFSFDITEHLQPGSEQEVVVGVFDPTDHGKQPRGKQVTNPHGIWYTPSSGLWQTVWLEPVPQSYVGRLSMVPDVDAGELRLKVAAEGETGGLTVRAVASDGGSAVAEATGGADAELRLAIPDAKLWAPGSPHLYDLRVELLRDGQVVDAVDSYFGMRKISLGKDEQGITRLFLNNKPLFHMGPLDQGFWPDGLHTAPTDEALRWDIEFTRDLGFNMIRKHIKVEPARWYYWADKLGLMVWQDMPSPSRPETEEERAQFENELKRMIEARGNSPSIVMWVVWNEGWGQYDTERLTKWVKETDPSRLVNNASGWYDKKVGDVMDMHRYPGPGSPMPEPERAAVLGEYGGLGLKIEGHLWRQDTYHYKPTESKEQLTSQYEELMRHIERLKKDPGLSAAVYTQTTDVEGENNGLVTYDREVVKVDMERVARANRGELEPIAMTALVEPADVKPQEWKYTTENPGEGWEKPDFSDAAWKTASPVFGNEKCFLLEPRTEWKTSDLWARREFTMPDPAPEGRYVLLIHADDQAEIYVNGVKAGESRGVVNYLERPLSDEARAALRPGRNVIAVHARQTGGAQAMDVGLVVYGK